MCTGVRVIRAWIDNNNNNIYIGNMYMYVTCVTIIYIKLNTSLNLPEFQLKWYQLVVENDVANMDINDIILYIFIYLSIISSKYVLYV